MCWSKGDKKGDVQQKNHTKVLAFELQLQVLLLKFWFLPPKCPVKKEGTVFKRERFKPLKKKTTIFQG